MSDNDALLTSIYTAAIDGSRWIDALDAVRQLAGGQSASFHSIDLDPDTPYSVNILSGSLREVSEEKIDFYLREYGHYDKTAWSIFCEQPARRVFPESVAYGDMDEIRNREDFAWLEENCGIFRRVAARLNDNAGWLDGIVIHLDRSRQTIPDSLAPAVDPILPHLAKANELHRLYQRLNDRYRAVLAVLDRVLVGTCVVSRSCQALIANDMARAAAENSGAFQFTTSGYLRFRQSDDDRRFRAAVQSACSSASGDNGISEQLLTVTRGPDRLPLLIEVSPIRDALGELSAGLTGAIVFVIDPEADAPVDSRRILSAYGLTQSECAVSELLMQGFTNREIAECRNVSVETVKSQIQSIRQKSRAQDRIALVRALLKTSPPVG